MTLLPLSLSLLACVLVSRVLVVIITVHRPVSRSVGISLSFVVCDFVAPNYSHWTLEVQWVPLSVIRQIDGIGVNVPLSSSTSLRLVDWITTTVPFVFRFYFGDLVQEDLKTFTNYVSVRSFTTDLGMYTDFR